VSVVIRLNEAEFDLWQRKLTFLSFEMPRLALGPTQDKTVTGQLTAVFLLVRWFTVCGAV
jgi:hypothetical protein